MKYFRISYTYAGGSARTITQAADAVAAWLAFQKDNPHVTVTQVEDESGYTITSPKP